MGSFIQVIEYSSSRIDEIRVLGEKVQAERSGEEGGPRFIRITEDRDKPGHYYTIVEFESYEKAMENSNHPATQAFAASLAELVDGPPTFINLDVIQTYDV
jgi:quinol monooxygenase YgiN